MKIHIELNIRKNRIPLTRGKFATIDRKNFDWLNQWKWHCNSNGYAVRREHIRLGKDSYRGNFIYMHRLIANTPDGMDTDHINNIKLDNREKNLRICTTSQNIRNKSMQSNNTSGFIGVHWNNHKQRWVAMVGVGGKSYTSHHVDLAEAARARDRLALLHHGEFAKLNFPGGTS